MAAACALVVPSGAAAATSTTTTITGVSNSAPAAGDPVTFTVSVVDSNNANVNGGTVTLYDASNHNWGTGAVSNGVATINVSGGFPGGSTLQIVAKFGGFGTDAKSTSPAVTITVGQTALPHTQVNLSVDKPVITSGDSATFTISVADTDTGTIPTGTVTLYGSFNGGAFVPLFPNSQLDISPADNAQGTITDQFNPAGTYTIQAQFTGSQYQPSTKQITLTVDPPPVTSTTTTTTVLANGGVISVTPTDDVVLTATVTQNVAISPPAGDVVNFFRQLNNSTNGYKEPLGQGDITWDVHDGSRPAVGTASLDTGSWPRGTYTVFAEFVGDQYDVASKGQSTLGVGGPETTTTTYIGDLTGTTGSPITLTGKLVDSQGLPLPNETLTLSLNGSPTETCTGVTTNAGIATCNVTVNEVGGSYPVKASFAGDGDLQPSDGGDTAVITGPAYLPTPTLLPYQGQTTAVAGSTETLTFELTDSSGNALPNLPVTISVDSTPAPPVTTDANGLASIQANLSTGTHAVTAEFAGAIVGTKQYLESPGAGTIVVSKLPTTLAYVGPASVTVGTQANVQFKLTDGSGNPLSGKSVAITINGTTVTVTTDGSGLATVPETLPAGSYPITASFDGTSDVTYDTSNGSGALTVDKIPTTTTGTTNPNVVPGATATLSATLVDGSNNPVAGRTVTLSFGANGVDSCSGVTDVSGHVSCQTAAVQSPASATPYTVNATFAGDDTYLGSSGTGSILVNTSQTTIVDKVTGNFLLGAPLTLTGTLTAGSVPLPGKTLTLTFGSASCTTTVPTDATGTASCVVTGGVPGPTGPTTTTASFAGDGTYRASSDSKPALVYAYAPGGGSFVVGDQTATGSVYFWGSQWWKKNVLSNGDPQAADPAAFKGFAANPSTPQCGVNWSTDPGNSTPPPDGPLPAYMAVIVTDHNHKAPGRIISGDTVSIVIVKTDSGYAPNPGHDGTGTVVATLCTGGTDQNSGNSGSGSSGSGSGCDSSSSAKSGKSNGSHKGDDGEGDGSGSSSCGGGGSVTCSSGGGKDASAAKGSASHRSGNDGSGVKCESVLANPSAAQGAQVSAGQTLSILYADDSAIGGTPSVTLDGQALGATVTATSGVKPTYVDSYGGSSSTKFESLISFKIPSGLASGSHTVVVTVQDGDGDYDVYSWTIKI